MKKQAFAITKIGLSLSIDKKETEVLPVWVKLLNLPMEAWSNKGISVVASSLDKPFMDQTTAKMCSDGVERLGYARALVEIKAVMSLRT